MSEKRQHESTKNEGYYMKLSTAIRVGAKMRPASKRGWSDVGPDGAIRSCALVAAAEGAGLFTIIGNYVVRGPNWMEPFGDSTVARDERKPSLSSRMPDEWLLVTSSVEIPPCPCGKLGVPGEVMLVIWHLHDIHGWSREAVAEWIETIETKVEGRIADREALRQKLLSDEELI